MWLTMRWSNCMLWHLLLRKKQPTIYYARDLLLNLACICTQWTHPASVDLCKFDGRIIMAGKGAATLNVSNTLARVDDTRFWSCLDSFSWVVIELEDLRLLLGSRPWNFLIFDYSYVMSYVLTFDVGKHRMWIMVSCSRISAHSGR